MEDLPFLLMVKDVRLSQLTDLILIVSYLEHEPGLSLVHR